MIPNNEKILEIFSFRNFIESKCSQNTFFEYITQGSKLRNVSRIFYKNKKLFSMQLLTQVKKCIYYSQVLPFKIFLEHKLILLSRYIVNIYNISINESYKNILC